MKAFIVALIAVMAVATQATAQTTPTKSTNPPTARPEGTGKTQEVPLGQVRVTGQVHVGETPADFTVASTSGREVTLSRLKGDWIVLVFVEDREEFGGFRQTQEGLASVGARIYGICKDKAHRLRTFAETAHLPFELLADDTGEISSLYGYYSLERRASTHGFVVLDRRGIVRLALQGQVPPEQVEALAKFAIVTF
jgi:peroxiredoxin